MRFSKLLKPAAAFAAILLAAMLNTSPRVKATDDDDDNSNDSRIQRGSISHLSISTLKAKTALSSD